MSQKVKRISRLSKHWKLHIEKNKFLLLLITDEELSSLFKDGTINNITYNPNCKGINLKFKNRNSEKIYTIQQTFRGMQPTWKLISSEECNSLSLPIFVSREIKSQAALILLNEFAQHKQVS